MRKLASVLLVLSALPCLAGTTYHVSPEGSHTPPFSDWATAATNIQDAVDAASAGDMVLVGDGTYCLASEILVTKDITIRSLNGPESAIVDGEGTRCFNLGSNACVVGGFAIQNGIADSEGSYEGGGVYCDNNTPVVTNCIVRNNWALCGSGLYKGTAIDCVIANNGMNGPGPSFLGGGACDSVVVDCIIAYNFVNNNPSRGGGLAGGMAVGCVIKNNSARNEGGGMSDVSATNCLILSNSARMDIGGGAFRGTANNCTFIGNGAQEGGGGMFGGTANNCIVCFNAAHGFNDNLLYTTVRNTCSPDATHGVDGNITNAPMFVDAGNGDYRLRATSPCIDAGSNGVVTTSTDIDGNERIIDGDLDGTATVDMGAYEFQITGVEIDVMPGRKRNVINLNSKWFCPVVVVSDDAFDAMEVDVSSVRFAGAEPVWSCRWDFDRDGDDDLLLFFRISDLELDSSDTVAVLTGQAGDGLLFTGADSVRVVPIRRCRRR